MLRLTSWLGLLLGAAPNPSGPTDAAPVQATFLSAVEQAAVEEPFLVGVRFRMAPGWHIYWRYPGNTGKPTVVEVLPGDTHGSEPPGYPVPRLFTGPTLAELSLGYEGEVVVPVEVVAWERPASGRLEVRSRASWLACKQACVEGSADLRVSVAVGDRAIPSAGAGALQQAVQAVPRVMGAGPSLAALGVEDGRIVVEISLPGVTGPARFLPRWFHPGACSVVSHDVLTPPSGPARARLVVQGSNCLPSVGGVVCPADGGACLELPPLAPAATTTTITLPSPVEPEPPPPADPKEGPSLWWFLLLAFLGGILLNVMPCVIPVVVPKLLHVVRSAGQVKDPGQRRAVLWRNALAYTGGVTATMLALAAVVVILRGVGAQVGWGFQFQSFWFLAFMVSLLTVLGLGMLHVFPLQGSGHHEALRDLKSHRAREPLYESFLTGLLVTFLGTPCTAPLLGPALGYAFSQPPLVVLTVFLAVALGLSFPFLVTGAWTGWTAILPTRVGPRYDKAMRAMGFLLFGTAVWLTSVVATAHGTQALTSLLWFQVILGALAWGYGSWVEEADSARTRLAKAAPLLFVATVAGVWLAPVAAGAGPSSAARDSSQTVLAWGVFSPDQVQRQQQQGRPVFIDFTADWCMNCKFNERMVLEKPETRALFDRMGVVALKGDFTLPDPVIQQWLQRFGRAGVPLYVVVPPCSGEAVALPELLTRDDLEAAVQRAGPARICDTPPSSPR
jgi:thiol:disulfide interchange protein DsbD